MAKIELTTFRVTNGNKHNDPSKVTAEIKVLRDDDSPAAKEDIAFKIGGNPDFGVPVKTDDEGEVTFIFKTKERNTAVFYASCLGTEEKVEIDLGGANMAQNNQNQGQNQQAKVKISIRADVGLPTLNPANGFFETGIVLRVIDNTQLQSVPGMEIRLFRDAQLVGNQVSDVNGEWSLLWREQASSAGKTVVFKATLSGIASAAENAFPLAFPDAPTKPVEKRAMRAEIKQHGRNGTYTITVQVLDENGQGLARRVKISEPDPPAGTNVTLNHNELPTDSQGWFTVNLPTFCEARRVVHVQVIGTEFDRELVLDGPAQPIFRSTPNFGEGFMKNLFRRQ